MPTPVSTHILDHQLACKKRATPLTIPTLAFTSFFVVTMLVMTTDTTSIEEQLAEMTYAIAKLTKTIEDKDLQITFLINKVEA